MQGKCRVETPVGGKWKSGGKIQETIYRKQTADGDKRKSLVWLGFSVFTGLGSKLMPGTI